MAAPTVGEKRKLSDKDEAEEGDIIEPKSNKKQKIEEKSENDKDKVEQIENKS